MEKFSNYKEPSVIILVKVPRRVLEEILRRLKVLEEKVKRLG